MRGDADLHSRGECHGHRHVDLPHELARTHCYVFRSSARFRGATDRCGISIWSARISCDSDVGVAQPARGLGTLSLLLALPYLYRQAQETSRKNLLHSFVSEAKGRRCHIQLFKTGEFTARLRFDPPLHSRYVGLPAPGVRIPRDIYWKAMLEDGA